MMISIHEHKEREVRYYLGVQLKEMRVELFNPPKFLHLGVTFIVLLFPADRDNKRDDFPRFIILPDV